MNVDLSGRENITLRGLYNGMSRRQIAAMAEDVAEFAELGEFLELPVRFYSFRHGGAAGLRHGDGDPAAGAVDGRVVPGRGRRVHDKARQRMESLVREAEILVLSTHNESIVTEWATRVIWLDQGRVREDGPTRRGAGALSGPRP